MHQSWLRVHSPRDQPSRNILDYLRRRGFRTPDGSGSPHQHRSTIAVVAGIVDVLQIEGGENPAPHVSVVVGLCNILPPIIERAIAPSSHCEQPPSSARQSMGTV